jgi:hypothetical protein
MVGVVGSSPIEPTNESEMPVCAGFSKLQQAPWRERQMNKMAPRTLTETTSERR